MDQVVYEYLYEERPVKWF